MKNEELRIENGRRPGTKSKTPRTIADEPLRKNRSPAILHSSFSILNFRISLGLALLTALCAWGGWAAFRPEWDTFLLDGARDIRYEPVGPGMQSLLFDYDGPVVPQTLRLYDRLERGGWQPGQPLRREDCGGTCLLGQVSLVFTRKSLFQLISEVATIEQRGVGPYHVRVVLRRCIRLPGLSCWPPG